MVWWGWVKKSPSFSRYTVHMKRNKFLSDDDQPHLTRWRSTSHNLAQPHLWYTPIGPQEQYKTWYVVIEGSCSAILRIDGKRMGLFRPLYSFVCLFTAEMHCMSDDNCFPNFHFHLLWESSFLSSRVLFFQTICLYQYNMKYDNMRENLAHHWKLINEILPLNSLLLLYSQFFFCVSVNSTWYY